MRTLLLAGSLLAACSSPAAPGGAAAPDAGVVEVDGAAAADASPADGSAARIVVPDLRCPGAPDAGPAGSFNHLTSEAIAALGDPRHRGFDLVTAADAQAQSIEGWIAYTIADKALEDEDVDLFACQGGAWAPLGTATTDSDGHFALALAGDARLSIAMRDLYVSVVGDRTGAAFLGYVAPATQPILVSDVDGTLTSSEDAFFETIALGTEPAQQPGASAAYQAAAGRGYQVIYVTARGGQYTTDTRAWLDDQGFPRGPVRLSPSFVTLPGADTIAYKTQTIGALAASLPVALGVGNRQSDITAYAGVGIGSDAIYVKLPEYQSEVQAALDAHQAIGFDAYADLQATVIDALPAH